MPSNSNLDLRHLKNADASRARETVILVHGTWANYESTSPPWWEPRSEFVKELDIALAAAGSEARCWAPQSFWIARPEIFAWTGDNSQSQRHGASLALAYLLSWFERETEFRYHIVAHSHGGNVVLGALDALARDPRRLGAVIFLGTPVLNFSAAPRLSRRVQRYGPGALFGAGLLVSAWVMISGVGGTRVAAAVLILVFALVLLLEFGRLSKDPIPKRKRSSLYGSGQPYAYLFDSDEAIAGLTRTVQAMKKPRELIEKLMPVSSVRKYTSEPWVENDGIQLLDTWPILTLSGMRHVWRDRRTSSWTQILWTPILAVASTIAVVPYLLIFAWQAFGSLLSALIAKFRRWLIKYPGASVVGRVVTGAAVGADQGSFESVSSLPPGVERRQALSEELQTRMRATTRAALAAVGESLGARVFGLSYEDLAATVAAGDEFVQLAHSQYYREAEIIEGIATHICAHGLGDTSQFPRAASLSSPGVAPAKAD